MKPFPFAQKLHDAFGFLQEGQPLLQFHAAVDAVIKQAAELRTQFGLSDELVWFSDQKYETMTLSELYPLHEECVFMHVHYVAFNEMWHIKIRGFGEDKRDVFSMSSMSVWDDVKMSFIGHDERSAFPNRLMTEVADTACAELVAARDAWVTQLEQSFGCAPVST